MDIELAYKEYSHKIFRLCYAYVNDSNKAKDLMQDTFISVIENSEKFNNKSNIGTWVFRIATNKCLRQLERDKKVVDKTHLKVEYEEMDFDSQSIIDEKYQFLVQCISELNEIDRLIIGLYLEDLNQEKIATIVGISHASVRVKLHRIRKELMNKFKQNGQF